jgi:hypothetical protein
MAVWQFSMILVPREEVMAICPSLGGAVSEEAFESIQWWSSVQPPEDLPAKLALVLPECPHWSRSARQWGQEPGNTIAVWYEADRVRSIYARLDVREWEPILVEFLVDLAVECDGRWLAGDAQHRYLVGPADEDLVRAVKESNAARFVRDPEGFLRQLGKSRRV